MAHDIIVYIIAIIDKFVQNLDAKALLSDSTILQL